MIMCTLKNVYILQFLYFITLPMGKNVPNSGGIEQCSERIILCVGRVLVWKNSGDGFIVKHPLHEILYCTESFTLSNFKYSTTIY